ncbi:MAG: SEL1-like repeat protein [Thermoguttaceae bacterium]|nr:SEL1-like repeat protein [Thermoguttaceae bacterium]
MISFRKTVSMTALLLTISLFTASFSRLEAYDWDDVESCKQAAEQGNAEAQFELGLRYKDSDGVAEDMTQAAKWFRKAAEQDHPGSQYILGACYMKGFGVSKNAPEGVKWLRKAAEQGHPEAQTFLGACYGEGIGVSKDMTQAAKWFRKAADQGYAEAQYGLGMCYLHGIGVSKDESEAVKWLRKAAEQGHAGAQYNLGVNNDNGVSRDKSEAIKLWRKAAEQGHAEAQHNLASSYLNGDGVPQDKSEAVKWFRKAAEQGLAGSQYNLGLCYMRGIGVSKDMTQAAKWFRKAAEQGNAEAQCNLGLCYMNGDGVAKDMTEAVKWWRKAAQQGDVKAIKILEDQGVKTEDFTSSQDAQESTPKTNQTTANASQSSGTKAGERLVKIINGVEFAFRWCPAGTFIMGSPESEEGRAQNETPHQVTLSKGFWMMETEVTQKQWRAVMGNNPSKLFKGDNHPVESVSWNDCQEFCRKTGLQLPTEAQWEYACRAGSTGAYAGNLDDMAWYSSNSGRQPITHPVGTKKPNAWGLYDMHGNVSEWCQDVWDGEDYPVGRITDPTGPLNDTFRFRRGGAIGFRAESCRSAWRGGNGAFGPDIRVANLGFRCVIMSNEGFTPSQDAQESTPKTNQTTANASQSSGTKAGERLVKIINGVEFVFRWCPAGTFIMGSPESEKGRDRNETQHQVTLSKGFWMMETEVTQKQWKAVMGNNPSKFNGDNLPVECVSWNDCQEFCRKTGLQLPTEAQWEYACRAGTTGSYAGNVNNMAWFWDYSDHETHPVGTKKPNAWGLYDMHGNVSEWCQDRYAKFDPSGIVTDPGSVTDSIEPKSGSFLRVNRGGSWGDDAWDCRSAQRNRNTPDASGSDLGFRLVSMSNEGFTPSQDAQESTPKTNQAAQSVSQDKSEAVKLFRKSAEQGDAEAQYELGLRYRDGKGVAQDYKEAAKWFHKAAEQGYAKAQFTLGVCYWDGKGVSQDKSESIKWYRKAAQQGLAEAQYNIGVCYWKGDGVSQDKSEAVKWYLKAAEQGDAVAQYDLGVCYRDGDGVYQDKSEAVKWFRKAAEQGLAAAQSNLGLRYLNGDGVYKDLNEAVKWFRKAAEQGEAVGQFNLGSCYMNGVGVSHDKSEAVKWYRKAAQQEYPDAQAALGACYMYGIGVSQDNSEAVKWFRKAAKQGHQGAIEILEEWGESY